jgi:hypothetical protein
MTEIKFRTPEVIAAEEQARKAALQRAFGRPETPSWKEVAVPVVTPLVPAAPSGESVTRREPQPAALAVEEAASVAPTTVSININVPVLKLPRVSPEHAVRLKNIALKLKSGSVMGFQAAQPYLKRFTLPRRQVATVAGGAVLSLSLIAGGNHLWQAHTRQRQAALVAAAAAKVASAKITVKPKFAPVTPASKTDLAAGKAGQTAYDTQHGTFSYSDTLDGHQLTVSQQPLPTKFKSAQDAVTSIAKDLKATQPILTKQGTAYAVTDPKANSQTIVYSLNNLLIFINSPFTHQSSEWVSYLNNLKQN